MLQYLLAEGEKLGCSQLHMLSYKDSDNNRPLHTAVQFGNVYAVRVCLEYGASVAEANEVSGNTAVHTACAQGSLEILKIMQAQQPKVFAELMFANVSGQLMLGSRSTLLTLIEIRESEDIQIRI